MPEIDVASELFAVAVFGIGGVRDFLYFYKIEWPVFNVADCCLVCGAFLLLAQAFLAQPVAAPAVAAPRGATPSPEVARAQ